MEKKEYGICPICNTPLENFGAESSGDEAIYDVIRCPTENCEYQGYDIHAKYCECIDCLREKFSPYYSHN